MARVAWLIGWFLLGFFGIMLVALVWESPKAADEYAIGTILASDHFTGDDHNEDQWPSLYGGWRHGENIYALGFYENSEDRETWFFTYGQQYSRYVSAGVGGATGYDASPILPFFYISWSLGPVKISLLPNVVAAGLEHRWEPEYTQ